MPIKPKFNRELRLKIGKEVYEKKAGITEAAWKYSLSKPTVRSYLNEYKAVLKAREERQKKMIEND